MFDLTQFRELIIKPVLLDLQMYSPEAMELLVFTCATESSGGKYLKQVRGPALGVFQMEPATYNDLWQNYIIKNPRLALILASNFNTANMHSEDVMIYDLRYATAMARIFYHRIPKPLPAFDDVHAIWAYYKKYYNTAQGAANEAESILQYNVWIKTSLPDSARLIET